MYPILLGTILLLSFYVVNILKYYTSAGEGYYLTLGMVTDFAYLKLMVSDDVYLQEGLTFSYLPLFIERYFISTFGFQYTWLMLILYKVISYLIFLIGFKNLLDSKSRTLYLMASSLALFFCIDLAPFWDRYPRPLFDNIFLILIFTINFYLLQKKLLSNTLYSIYGMSHAILALTNPWSAVIIAPMSVISILSVVRSSYFLKPTLSLISFTILLMPFILYFYGNLGDSSHREYLGLKDIYNPIYYLQDYFISLLHSKQFLLVFSIITLSSLILKRKVELYILIICTLLAPLVFVLLGKSVQSYHLTNGVKEFEILICIVLYLRLIQRTDIKTLGFKIKNFDLKIFISSVFLGIFLISLLGNSWISRSSEVQYNWQKYSIAFQSLNEKPSDCIVISNDQVVRRYWSGLKNGPTLPQDGFYRTSSIEVAIEEVSEALNILNSKKLLSKEEIDSLLKFGTHNYFVSTRSTITKTMPFKDNVERKSYIDSRRNINSFYHWTFAPPENIYESLNEKRELDKASDIPKQTILIYRTKKNGETKLHVIDNCSQNLNN